MGMPPYMAVISGLDHRHGDMPYVNQVFIGSGGGPGGPSADGWPTYLIPVCASLVYKDSVEVDEQRYPIHVYEQALIPDSEGAGRHRGGLGCRTVYGPKRNPVSVAWAVEAHHHPPRGVRGGLAGSGADAWMIDAAGDRVDVDLVGSVELQPGREDRLDLLRRGRLRLPAGARSLAGARDVREGWIVGSGQPMSTGLSWPTTTQRRPASTRTQHDGGARSCQSGSSIRNPSKEG